MKYSSADEFLNADHKSITLMGMSGVGKSYLSLQMAEWGWSHFSCDLEIANVHLKDKIQGSVSADDLSALSSYIGKVGDFPIDEFKARQARYYMAEVAALNAASKESAKHKKFVHDSTGSLCEITDEAVLKSIGSSTLFVYIQASKKEEIEILKRAEEYPKPLFFPPKMLDAWLHEYQQIFGVSNVDGIDGDDFVRWVFPKLFEMRLPKYERLAERYGVTIPSSEIHGVKDEQGLLNLIAGALG